MKRYLLFIGDVYYPEGGMKDFVSDFDDLTIAIAYAKGRRDEGGSMRRWGHVYDTERHEIVWAFPEK